MDSLGRGARAVDPAPIAHKFRALIGIAVVTLLVSSAMPQEFWDRMSTLTAPVEERDASAQGRLHFWEVAQVMARAKPLTGVGFNGFRASYNTYDTTPGEYGEDRSVHSVWFGLLSEMGYPGLSLFIAILAVALWGCRQVARIAKRNALVSDLGHYANAISTSFVVFIVGGSFLPSQYNEMLWHFVGMTMALHAVATSESLSAAVEPGKSAVALAPAMAR